jgi:hypothetical protein
LVIERCRNPLQARSERVALFLGRAGKSLTKPPRFLPGLPNLSAKLSELVGGLHDDECDHG